MILKWACLCGCQDEGDGDPPLCWGCSKPMFVWPVRPAERTEQSPESGDD